MEPVLSSLLKREVPTRLCPRLWARCWALSANCPSLSCDSSNIPSPSHAHKHELGPFAPGPLLRLAASAALGDSGAHDDAWSSLFLHKIHAKKTCCRASTVKVQYTQQKGKNLDFCDPIRFGFLRCSQPDGRMRVRRHRRYRGAICLLAGCGGEGVRPARLHANKAGGWSRPTYLLLGPKITTSVSAVPDPQSCAGRELLSNSAYTATCIPPVGSDGKGSLRFKTGFCGAVAMLMVSRRSVCLSNQLSIFFPSSLSL